jgi:hypothetical protein
VTLLPPNGGRNSSGMSRCRRTNRKWRYPAAVTSVGSSISGRALPTDVSDRIPVPVDDVALSVVIRNNSARGAIVVIVFILVVIVVMVRSESDSVVRLTPVV